MLVWLCMEVCGASMRSNSGIPLIDQCSLMQDVFYLIWPCSIKSNASTTMPIFDTLEKVPSGHGICNTADAVKLHMLPWHRVKE
jgi:hypothetical protein